MSGWRVELLLVGIDGKKKILENWLFADKAQAWSHYYHKCVELNRGVKNPYLELTEPEFEDPSITRNFSKRGS